MHFAEVISFSVDVEIKYEWAIQLQCVQSDKKLKSHAYYDDWLFSARNHDISMFVTFSIKLDIVNSNCLFGHSGTLYAV